MLFGTCRPPKRISQQNLGANRAHYGQLGNREQQAQVKRVARKSYESIDAGSSLSFINVFTELAQGEVN